MRKEKSIKSFEKENGSIKEAVTVKEYAKHVCVTRQAVEKAIETGRIPKEAISYERVNGKLVTCIDKSVADIYWVNSANTGYGTPEAREAVERIKSEIGSVDIKTKAGCDDNLSYSEALRKEKNAKAEKAKIELLQLKGVLVERDIVYKQLFEAGQMLRDAIMGVPDRIVAELVSANGNQTQIRKILTEALASALEGLTDVYAKDLG